MRKKQSVLLSVIILFFCANYSRGVVARASRLCVSTKSEFLETHGRDARATIFGCGLPRQVYPWLKNENPQIQKISRRAAGNQLRAIRHRLDAAGVGRLPFQIGSA